MNDKSIIDLQYGRRLFTNTAFINMTSLMYTKDSPGRPRPRINSFSLFWVASKSSLRQKTGTAPETPPVPVHQFIHAKFWLIFRARQKEPAAETFNTPCQYHKGLREGRERERESSFRLESEIRAFAAVAARETRENNRN